MHDAQSVAELERAPFAQRQSAVGEAGCGDAPQPVKLAKTARTNTAHIMVMPPVFCVVELPGACVRLPCAGYAARAS
eukprot:COSAG06_NODE_12714_length_1339_cov_6.137097_2_plen_77_part_00